MARIHAIGFGLIAAIALAGSASAADLSRRYEPVTKAPAYAPYYNWTGFYLGINGGGGWGRSEWSNAFLGSTGDFDLSGGLIGVTGGYNYQIANWVVGVEADVDWTNIRGSTTAPGAICAFSCNTRNTWLATVRGRVGYAWDRVLPYVTGGAAFGNIRANLNGLPEASDEQVGWTVGGGIEFAIVGGLTAKAEYLYVDLGSFDCPATSCGGPGTTSVDFRSHIVRAGLNYRF